MQAMNLKPQHKRLAIVKQLGNKINAGRKQAGQQPAAVNTLAGQYFAYVRHLDVAEISITIDCMRDYAQLIMAQDWAALQQALKQRVSVQSYPVCTTEAHIAALLAFYRQAHRLVCVIITTACWDGLKEALLLYDFGRKSIRYTGKRLMKAIDLQLYVRCRRIPKFLQADGVVAVYRIDLANMPSVYLQVMANGSVWAFKQSL